MKSTWVRLYEVNRNLRRLTKTTVHGTRSLLLLFKTFILTQEICLYCSANNQSEHSQKMGLMEKPNCRFYRLQAVLKHLTKMWKPTVYEIRISIWSHFAPCKEIWIPDSRMREVLLRGIRNPGKLGSMWKAKSWALESGIQFKKSRIPLKIGIQNPNSPD